MVIAIDGPAGAGKSTVARLLARRLGLTYLDSGAMYRCVALGVIEAEDDPGDPTAVEEIARSMTIEFWGDGDGPARVFMSGRDVSERIREPDVSAVASNVSVHPGVRETLVVKQRQLIAEGDYVAEGRDIGTVVSPESPLKIFLIADGAERARRRAAETGQPLETVLKAQDERDSRDRERAHGALRPAEDAVEIDSTTLSVDIVVERIASLAMERGIVADRPTPDLR